MSIQTAAAEALNATTEAVTSATDTVAETVVEIAAPAATGFAASASKLGTFIVDGVKSNQKVIAITGAVAATAAVAYGGYKLFKRHQAKKATAAKA